MAGDELTEVYSTNDRNQAEIIRIALEAEDIPCEISGENQAGLAGISGMEIRLFVRAIDHAQAREFIEEHLRGEGS